MMVVLCLHAPWLNQDCWAEHDGVLCGRAQRALQLVQLSASRSLGSFAAQRQPWGFPPRSDVASAVKHPLGDHSWIVFVQSCWNPRWRDGQ